MTRSTIVAAFYAHSALRDFRLQIASCEMWDVGCGMWDVRLQTMEIKEHIA